MAKWLLTALSSSAKKLRNLTCSPQYIAEQFPNDLCQDLGISKVGHMKRILQGTKDLAKASMVDL